MVLLFDIPSVVEVVYLVSQHGEVNVCPADGTEEHVWILQPPPLDPIIIDLPPETLDPEHYAPAGHLGVHVRRSKKQGGVPTRFLGSGTGGMAGR